MKREAVIRLTCKVRSDGSIHVSSPHVPLFHVVGRDAAQAQALAISVLKEYLALNYALTAELRSIGGIDTLLAGSDLVPSAFQDTVIAEMAA